MIKPKLSIIGTAGRKEDQGLLTDAHYERMVGGAVKLIGHLGLDPQQLQLYSGGAAWADHIVVTMVLRGLIPPENLTLFLPAKLEYYGYEAEDQTNLNQKRTADTCNYYHKLFSTKTGFDSIKELNTVVKMGATTDVALRGFHARNALVARAMGTDGHVLAFTFGLPNTSQVGWTIRSFDATTTAKDAELKDGGTAHTWDCAKCHKHHARIGTTADAHLTI